MIGNIILWIKKVFKQQTCLHKYKWINASYRTNGSCRDFEECTKCEKIK
jgi:hypothetical protein